MQNKGIIIKQLRAALKEEFAGEVNTPFLRECATDFVMEFLKKAVHGKGYFHVHCNEDNNSEQVISKHQLVVDFSYMVNFDQDATYGKVSIGLKDSGVLHRIKSLISK